YNINNIQITGASFLGAVGLDWQPSGFGNFSSRNEGDMLLRNVNTGGLMLYIIANNQITGSFFLGNLGLDWQHAAPRPAHGPVPAAVLDDATARVRRSKRFANAHADARLGTRCCFFW